MALVYVYFDFKDPSQTASNVACSLLMQLVSRLKSIPPSLQSLHQRLSPLKKRLDLNASIEHFLLSSSQYSSVFVVIDAFDECDDGQHNSILSLIRRLSQSSVRVLVTSRPHVQKFSILSRECPSLEVRADNDDVRRYVTTRLAQEPDLAEELKESIATKLTTGAEGM